MQSQTSVSPYRKLRNVNVGAVTWTHGFWADRFAVCRDVMIPNMWELLTDPADRSWYTNFLVAAGLQEGDYNGCPFSDGDFYKWLEAVAYVYGVTHEARLDQWMDEIIAVLAQAQRADGYLHTPVLIKQRRGEPDGREFSDRLDFEMYNFGHLMITAGVHYQATGKTTLLAIAEKLSAYLAAAFQHPTPELAKNSICPVHYMGLIDLYRTTGEQKHLNLLKMLVEMRTLMEGGSDDNQDRIPFPQQTTAVGHAVRANYLYAGIADLCAETGDQAVFEVLDTIWQNVVFQKMYVTGACGALYDGASPDGSSDHFSIKLTHQAYGREYQLPNVTAYNETCANLGHLFWNWRMLAVTGEARFADIVELVLYNSALSGISLDGKRFFYTNTLRQEAELPFELRWSRTREPHIPLSFCCPPNIVRVIAEVGSYAYSLSEDGVWVHLYGGSVLETELADGSRLKLTQQTDYPWDGNIKLTVDITAPANFAVHLRIPGWTTTAALRINGQPYQGVAQPGTYLTLQRTWSAGDVIELDFPMRVVLIEAHPLVEECRQQVALKRGPVVYCLESVDLPNGVQISEIVIPHDIALMPHWGEGVLKDIRVLEGQAEVVTAGDWSRQLYREFRPQPAKPIDVTFIPYYAWDNRGVSEMTVWLPVR
jgi:uncharacterized protein